MALSDIQPSSEKDVATSAYMELFAQAKFVDRLPDADLSDDVEKIVRVADACAVSTIRRIEDAVSAEKPRCVKLPTFLLADVFGKNDHDTAFRVIANQIAYPQVSKALEGFGVEQLPDFTGDYRPHSEVSTYTLNGANLLHRDASYIDRSLVVVRMAIMPQVISERV